MRRIGSILILVAATLAGCGVDWFPEYHREPTTPDAFTFATKTGADPGSTVTSDAITVSGLTADSSPISVSGDQSSKYSINGGTATASAATVKNGDAVTVQHTAASTVSTSVTSTLTIGNVSSTFTSVTKPVAISASQQKSAPAGTTVFSDPIKVQLVNGLHTVSIVNGSFALEFVNNPYFSTAQNVVLNNGETLFVAATAPATPGMQLVTTLTIDNVATFTLTTTAQ